MKFEHTPGPWTYFFKDKYKEHHVSVPVEGSNMHQALFPNGCPTKNPKADSLLIAAGPLMRKALEILLRDRQQAADRGCGTLTHGEAILLIEAVLEAAGGTK